MVREALPKLPGHDTALSAITLCVQRIQACRLFYRYDQVPGMALANVDLGFSMLLDRLLPGTVEAQAPLFHPKAPTLSGHCSVIGLGQ